MFPIAYCVGVQRPRGRGLRMRDWAVVELRLQRSALAHATMAGFRLEAELPHGYRLRQTEPGRAARLSK